MTNVTHLECSLTGERYEAGRIHNLSRAGKPLLVRYDLDAAKRTLTRDSLAAREPGMWKWRELLPHDGEPVSLGEPETPIVALPRTGGANLLVKDEGRLPTGSFKARGLAMAVTMAKQLGIERIAMPTNGNAGAALAAYGARAGIETIVICPAETPEINVTETAAYGARVYVADGQIDECGALVGKGAADGLWFDCSTLKEPYRIEGKKTMGYEIAEQLGWRVPDVILYPAGGGVGLIGIHKAMLELQQLGWIGDRMPRLVAVQSTGCSPIVDAFEAGLEESTYAEGSHTVAFGINVPKALGDFLVLRAVRESGGTAVAVPDDEILAEVAALASAEGAWICPEGAACLAAARRLRAMGWLSEDDEVVVLNPGAGLKYPETVTVDVPVLARDGRVPQRP
ncbi:MAG: threonine synthase [Sphingomicrobium sp.]